MNCIATREGEAPNPLRSAISRRRPSDRTSSRLAAFTAASSNSSAAASNVSNTGRIVSTITSVNATIFEPWPRLKILKQMVQHGIFSAVAVDFRNRVRRALKEDVWSSYC